MLPAASRGNSLSRKVYFVTVLVLYCPYRPVPTRKKWDKVCMQNWRRQVYRRGSWKLQYWRRQVYRRVQKRRHMATAGPKELTLWALVTPYGVILTPLCKPSVANIGHFNWPSWAPSDANIACILCAFFFVFVQVGTAGTVPLQLQNIVI